MGTIWIILLIPKHVCRISGWDLFEYFYWYPSMFAKMWYLFLNIWKYTFSKQGINRLQNGRDESCRVNQNRIFQMIRCYNADDIPFLHPQSLKSCSEPLCPGNDVIVGVRSPWSAIYLTKYTLYKWRYQGKLMVQSRSIRGDFQKNCLWHCTISTWSMKQINTYILSAIQYIPTQWCVHLLINLIEK